MGVEFSLQLCKKDVVKILGHLPAHVLSADKKYDGLAMGFPV